ncbi:MAG: hypothetical protein KDN22_29710 [Verrucomicrobiae bacterium]|nr:hypothetical protein [Verrucomicrobiae bacterium]
MSTRSLTFLIWIALGVLLGLLVGEFIRPGRKSLQASTPPIGTTQTRHQVPSTANLYAALPAPSETTVETVVASLRDAGLAVSPNRERTEAMRRLLALTEDPDSIVAIIHQIQGSDLTSTDRARSLSMIFKHWAGKDPSAAFGALELVDDENDLRQAMHSVLEVWALANHDAALTAVKASALKQVVDDGPHIILNALSDADPERALLVARSLGDEKLTRAVHHQVVAKEAVNDMASTWAGLSRIDDPDLQASLRDSAIDGLANKDRAAALAYAEKLTDSVKRQSHVRTIFRNWPLANAEEARKAFASYPATSLTDGVAFDFGQSMNLAEPQQALAFADLLEGDVRDDYLLGVLTEQAIKQPAETAEIASQYLQEDTHLARIYQHLGESWAGKDEYAAAEWLSQLPSSAARDQAVSSFSQKLFSIDPERAVQWAMSIDGEQERTTHIERLVEQWQATDADAANDWLEQANIVPRQR